MNNDYGLNVIRKAIWSILQILFRVILRKIFCFQISDLTKISFKSCSAMKSAGIFVSGDYLINGFSTPQTCQLWGRPFLRPCHLPDLRTLLKKKIKNQLIRPHQKHMSVVGSVVFEALPFARFKNPRKQLQNFISETACPFGWKLFDDVCLKVNETLLTFDDANLKGCSLGFLYTNVNFGFFIRVYFIV